MGKPIKVTAEGRSFYLCCKNCEKEVKDDPKGVARQARQAEGRQVTRRSRDKDESGPRDLVSSGAVAFLTPN